MQLYHVTAFIVIDADTRVRPPDIDPIVVKANSFLQAARIGFDVAQDWAGKFTSVDVNTLCEPETGGHGYVYDVNNTRRYDKHKGRIVRRLANNRRTSWLKTTSQEQRHA